MQVNVSVKCKLIFISIVKYIAIECSNEVTRMAKKTKRKASKSKKGKKKGR